MMVTANADQLPMLDHLISMVLSLQVLTLSQHQMERFVVVPLVVPSLHSLGADSMMDPSTLSPLMAQNESPKVKPQQKSFVAPQPTLVLDITTLKLMYQVLVYSLLQLNSDMSTLGQAQLLGDAHLELLLTAPAHPTSVAILSKSDLETIFSLIFLLQFFLFSSSVVVVSSGMSIKTVLNYPPSMLSLSMVTLKSVLKQNQ